MTPEEAKGLKKGDVVVANGITGKVAYVAAHGDIIYVDFGDKPNNVPIAASDLSFNSCLGQFDAQLAQIQTKLVALLAEQKDITERVEWMKEHNQQIFDELEFKIHKALRAFSSACGEEEKVKIIKDFVKSIK